MARSVDRRTYLAAATAGALAAAGCMGGGDSDDGSDDDAGDRTAAYPDAAGTYDDFEDLDRWDVREGSASADADRSYVGSQSARLSMTESETQVRIGRELDEPADFSAVVPGLAMRSDETLTPVIQLIDDGGDRIEYRATSRPDAPFVRHNFGVGAVEGDPDRGSIVEIQIVLWLGDEKEGELWVDDLHFVPAVDDGAVAIQLDGGYETHHAYALSVLEEHDLPATAFVPTDRIREDDESEGDRLTEAQLADLADAGWTIGSHGARGLNLASLQDADPESAVADAADWLADEGYDPEYFSFPAGYYDEAALSAVEDHHDLAFTGRFPAQGYASNPHLCQRVTDVDATTARDHLDLTAERGGLTSLVFYDLADEAARTTFEETVEHLAELESAGDVDVVTAAEVAEYVYEE